mmetsp:Transcript_1871/g.3323  ORF Transcript_1871/g.3323 Transcript_1871/m.3323 type:complete len:607 (+) Transcript_1871:51-1871(+)|eukprot:CAMPEP_0169081044 /NCGR_PEP_ID=MMETSP1015-20121227/10800_1 /TAXON_ID=342587 /ORGANISM="Karlodinium micrum, Strain CCMP2283" /LENGTH=606 /DNA_ID=CAMNT_0009140805 /DNA_START=49 /DNA_END=1869 /DNA_ORIENTATION=-
MQGEAIKPLNSGASKPKSKLNSTSFEEWNLSVGASVYGAAFLAPNIRGSKLNGAQWLSLMFTLTFVLTINFFLQYTVMHKVYNMTQEQVGDVKGRLLGNEEYKGLCWKREPGSLPIQNHLDSSSDEMLFDCSMLTVTMMSDMHLNLVEEDDKYWTRKKANATGTAWEHKYGKMSALTNAFFAFQVLAENGELEFQKKELAKDPKNKDELQERWRSETDDYTRIPYQWMEAEQGKIDLCVAQSAKLCGNLELRGSLESKLGKVQEDVKGAIGSIDERISRCKSVIGDYCPKVYGELYRIYVDWSQELCGSPSALWHNDKRLITYVFEMAEAYYDGSTSVTSQAYKTFLFLILLIWLLSMFKEVRRVLSWWVVVLLMPSDDKETGAFVKRGETADEAHDRRMKNKSKAEAEAAREEGDHDALLVNGGCCTVPEEKDAHIDIDIAEGKQRVLAIPMYVKIHCIMFHLIPRTYIAANLPLVGARFLMSAENPSDLILNSVALAFLIEIDEMLFGATASEAIQSMVANTEELSVGINKTLAWVMEVYHDYIPYMFSFTSLIMGLVWYMVDDAYNREGGKLKLAQAFKCLCQAEGDFCVSAQILGGLPEMPK